MSEDPKLPYESPKVEVVKTEDVPAVTAAGFDESDGNPSDLRLKRSLRPLRALSQDPKPSYEAPKVEVVKTEDAPAVTSAGLDSDDESDLRLKRSLRPLRARIIRPR